MSQLGTRRISVEKHVESVHNVIIKLITLTHDERCNERDRESSMSESVLCLNTMKNVTEIQLSLVNTSCCCCASSSAHVASSILGVLVVFLHIITVDNGLSLSEGGGVVVV